MRKRATNQRKRAANEGKKAKSIALKMVEEEDRKGLQKVETKRQKRAVQKGENGEKWTAN